MDTHTGAVVHLQDGRLTAWALLDFIALLSRGEADERARAHLHRLLSGGVFARLVRMPRGLAMVAERRVAARPQALDLGARGVAGGDHGEAAVGRRTPSRVGDGLQDASDHELFVLGNELGLITEDARDITRMNAFGTVALRAVQRHAPFGDLQLQVTSQACAAVRVRADGEPLELIVGILVAAERARLEDVVVVQLIGRRRNDVDNVQFARRRSGRLVAVISDDCGRRPDRFGVVRCGMGQMRLLLLRRRLARAAVALTREPHGRRRTARREAQQVEETTANAAVAVVGRARGSCS